MSKAKHLLEMSIGVILNIQNKLASPELDNETKEKLALAVLEDPFASEGQKAEAQRWLDSYKGTKMDL